MVNAAVPLLVSVTGLAPLAIVTGWFPNARDVGDRVTAGAATTNAEIFDTNAAEKKPLQPSVPLLTTSAASGIKTTRLRYNTV